MSRSQNKPSKKPRKEPSGCGCGSIPISVIILFLGGCYWLFTQRDKLDIGSFLPSQLPPDIPFLNFPANEESTAAPTPFPSPPNSQPNPKPDFIQNTPSETSLPPRIPQKQKTIRGIYLSRYQVTNNADEKTIRERVRYYRDRGINTIIHGVWGNSCTMYESEVMLKKVGIKSCPNEFREQWLDWLIDEAHKQGMEVHAYFEKGIKIDENSPAFDLAVERRWIVAGIDRTHRGIDHYVLDVNVPEVADFLTDILVEFVQKYPEIDAVQWDDYLGYHSQLPGQVDRTQKLTNFVQTMIGAMKESNPSVKFDICHHNPYWAKKHFAADWETWDVDRVFIQVYNQENFNDELKYVRAVDGISITERQFEHLEELVNDSQIESILLFPLSGEPEKMAETFDQLMTNTN